VDHTPQRVVSLQPSATTVLARLGMLQRVVACTKWCRDVCPEVAAVGRAIVADSWTAQSQQILAARPDLVIASVPYQLDAVAEILKAGIPFLGLAPRTLHDVYCDIAKIAAIMGTAARGEELIAEMRRDIEAVRQKTHRFVAAEGEGVWTSGYIADEPRPRVFCEEWGKPIIRSQPWVRELVETAGGEFLGEAGQHATAEDVRAANPDVIILAWCGAGDRVPLEKMARERGWGETKAVTSGRVFCIRDEFLNTPGPTLIEGLRALAAAIRPEIFPSTPGLRRIGEGK
jgi:iron complex transport system substrate-binding protein